MNIKTGKVTAIFLSCMISFGIAHAQLNWYRVNQKGKGKVGMNGKIAVDVWAVSNATVTIDLQNSNIYIYDNGKTRHFNITERLTQAKSDKENTKVFEATNEEGINCKIGLCEYNQNKQNMQLSVYLPDGVAYVYKIRNQNINKEGK